MLQTLDSSTLSNLPVQKYQNFRKTYSDLGFGRRDNAWQFVCRPNLRAVHGRQRQAQQVIRAKIEQTKPGAEFDL